MMAEKKSAGKRQRKPFGSKQQQIFAFVGMVLFLTGLVATALLGQFNLITAALCVLGIVVGSVVFLPRVTRNLSVYVNMSLYSLFFCAAVVVFFVILQKHPLTLDATRSGSFTLSSVTSNFLQRLDQPIRATVFTSTKQQRNAASLLLGEYHRYAPQFEFRIVDYFREVDVARQFGGEVLPGEVYLERLTTGTQQTERRVEKVSKLEEEPITNAIVQLIRGKDLVLYFTTGHGEPSLEEDKVSAALTGQSVDPHNLKDLSDQLLRSYIRSVPINLGQWQSVPSDASAVVIVAPRVDFTNAEIRVLRDYLDRGGRVMFCLEPDIPALGSEVRTALTNIGALVKQFGVELSPEVVVLPHARQTNQSIFHVPAIPQQHRVTQGSAPGEPILVLDQARPVMEGTAPANTYLETFLVSDQQAWPFPIEELQRALLTRTEPNVQPTEDDLKSIPLGVTSTRMDPSRGEVGTAKIMVIGDGSFLTSRILTNHGWVLFMNGIDWLTDSGELIAIPSSQIENTPAILTDGQRRFLFILVVIAVPTLIALGGLGYSLSRRGGLM